jgi:hypothetical protein
VKHTIQEGLPNFLNQRWVIIYQVSAPSGFSGSTTTDTLSQYSESADLSASDAALAELGSRTDASTPAAGLSIHPSWGE